MQNKNLTSLYEKFENEVISLSDRQIINLLSQFKKDDYVNFPIIFDLVVQKKIAVLEYLHEKGVPFTYKDSSGAQALHVACGVLGSLEIVKFLTENDILSGINVQTDEGETPFLLAVMYNHEDIVRYLLNYYKPDLSITTVYGDDAFSLTKRNQNSNITLLLEDYKLRM